VRSVDRVDCSRIDETRKLGHDSAFSAFPFTIEAGVERKR
jgi:hypothetical protein